MHPFEKLSAPQLRRVYWIFLALTFGVAALLSRLAQYVPEHSANATVQTVPTVAFEFARTTEDWNRLAAEVGKPGLDALRVQTYYDYLFLIAYSTLLAAAVIGVASGGGPAWLTTLARGLAWGQWVAALADAIENYGLLCNIAGPVSETWTFISSTAAAIKFGLIVFGILFIYILLPRSWRGDAI